MKTSLICPLRTAVAAAFLTGAVSVGIPSVGFVSSAQAETSTLSSVYEAMPLEQIRERCQVWLEQQKPESLDAWKKQTAEFTSSQDGLQLVISAAAVANPEIGEFVATVDRAPAHQLTFLIEQSPLKTDDAWMQANLKFWLGLALSQRHLYEEAVDQLAPVDPTLVVDPASYFFHRAVGEHHLLNAEAAGTSLKSLLTETRPLPERYRTVGELMQQDLASLEEKGLDEIARKMRDVERRLNIGRSGQKVQKIEKEIIDSLDELIAKLEQQGGGGGGSGSGSGQSNQPSNPADESRVKGATAPGEVDEKDLANNAEWGNLPDKDQAKAKQILGTMFPPHYQRAIEAYNKKAAQRNQRP